MSSIIEETITLLYIGYDYTFDMHRYIIVPDDNNDLDFDNILTFKKKFKTEKVGAKFKVKRVVKGDTSTFKYKNNLDISYYVKDKNGDFKSNVSYYNLHKYELQDRIDLIRKKLSKKPKTTYGLEALKELYNESSYQTRPLLIAEIVRYITS